MIDQSRVAANGPSRSGPARRQASRGLADGSPWPLAGLQRAAGNRAVQRLVSGALGEIDGQEVSARIGAAEARGRELDQSVRGQLADTLGADPGPVRVHADAEGHELSRAVGAKAFTSGRDVFFQQGAFDPSSPEGFALLVHESTHVLQQAAGPVAGSATPDGALAISDPGDSFERAASSTAEGAVSSGPTSDARSVQRDRAADYIPD